MVCKAAWDILRESMGFSDELRERFKAGFGAEYDSRESVRETVRK